MSNTGLYSGHYVQISDYARLIDEVIIQLKFGASSPTEPSRQKLSKLLTDISSGTPSDLSLRALELLLRNGRAGDKRIWLQIADALGNGDVNERLIQQLETMAQVLESERAGTLAKLRGVGR